ncbi:unnamed protein product [Caretta caretta]
MANAEGQKQRLNVAFLMLTVNSANRCTLTCPAPSTFARFPPAPGVRSRSQSASPLPWQRRGPRPSREQEAAAPSSGADTGRGPSPTPQSEILSQECPWPRLAWRTVSQGLRAQQDSPVTWQSLSC